MEPVRDDAGAGTTSAGRGARLRMGLFPRGRRMWRRVAIFWGALLIVALSGIACVVWMPGRSWDGPLPPLSEGQRALCVKLEGHVHVLAGDIGERNTARHANLMRAADYIEQTLVGAGYSVSRQEFRAEGRPVCNLEVELRGTSRPEEVVVVGAHYDTVYVCPGANDNGSGVAALLELARHFIGRPRPRTVRFVAFVNEEPPYFRTDEMGSLVYARRCRERGERIVGMMSLETIGYYSDEKGSQQYPTPFSWFYPSRGNFIAFVANTSSGGLVRRAVRAFRASAQFPSQGVAAPGFITGIGWSDHWSFWQAGYPAFMVTDTAPFRYPFYHTEEDAPEKLDYERLSRVVDGLIAVVEEMAGG